MISGRVLLFAGACGAILVFGICRAHASPPGPDDTKIGSDIEGVVSDSATGERVPGANVIVRGTNRGAATNNNGFYLISSVPSGTYTLVVSAVGYQRRTIPVAVSGTGAQTVNIKLATRLIETREVVVETQSISALTERSASVHIITPKELQRLPAAGQQDLLRSLQVLPGITSTSDVSAKFFVRGGAGDQNLILLDGMKVYNPFHAFGLFSIFDPDIIRNAEVYTGAFPAGYQLTPLFGE
ncbi:MAG TPA: TonB-dependent receptor [Bacteroidota bacterium]